MSDLQRYPLNICLQAKLIELSVLLTCTPIRRKESMYSSTELYGSPLPRWSCIPASSDQPACDGTSDIH